MSLTDAEEKSEITFCSNHDNQNSATETQGCNNLQARDVTAVYALKSKHIQTNFSA